MNYVDIERRLIESIHNTYDDQIEGALLNIWSVSRKIDWLVLMTDHRRNLSNLFQMIGTNDNEILDRIVTASVLRIPELCGCELLESICESINWKVISKSNDDPINQNLELQPMNVFSESPDLVVLYMLSNMNLKQLER